MRVAHAMIHTMLGLAGGAEAATRPHAVATSSDARSIVAARAGVMGAEQQGGLAPEQCAAGAASARAAARQQQQQVYI